jgi:hypothetical protein
MRRPTERLRPTRTAVGVDVDALVRRSPNGTPDAPKDV